MSNLSSMKRKIKDKQSKLVIVQEQFDWWSEFTIDSLGIWYEIIHKMENAKTIKVSDKRKLHTAKMDAQKNIKHYNHLECELGAARAGYESSKQELTNLLLQYEEVSECCPDKAKYIGNGDIISLSFVGQGKDCCEAIFKVSTDELLALHVLSVAD